MRCLLTLFCGFERVERFKPEVFLGLLCKPRCSVFDASGARFPCDIAQLVKKGDHGWRIGEQADDTDGHPLSLALPSGLAARRSLPALTYTLLWKKVLHPPIRRFRGRAKGFASWRAPIRRPGFLFYFWSNLASLLRNQSMRLPPTEAEVLPGNFLLGRVPGIAGVHGRWPLLVRRVGRIVGTPPHHKLAGGGFVRPDRCIRSWRASTHLGYALA